MVVSRIAQEVADLVAEAWQAGPENGPRFGLLVDVEEASEDDMRRTIESIRRQTYQAWDLFLVGGVRAAPRFAFLQAVDSFDYRISVHIDEDSECDLARRRNDALRKAPSSWIGVLEPGDELAPFALDEVAALLDRSPGCQGVYADEDRELPGGRTTVRLKPEWSPEMLLGEFYIGRPWFLRRDVFDGLGGFRGETGVASEWDLWLRAGEKGVPIRRLPIPCCVRRIPPEGDDVASEARNEANVVRDHLRRLGLAAEVERLPNGIQRAFWPIVADPLVSIIIPNRNSLELLRECLDGLRRRTRYPHREILIVDNGSTEAEVLELYDFLTRSGEARVLPLEGAFNYSLACNLGAREANGKLLLFLNNDTEVLEPDWLEEMIRWTQVPGVGVVGCKLLYEDGRIQHAGVTLGLNGTCAHLFSGAGEENTAGPFGSADQYRNLIAVTGACQLLPRDVYEHVGGFDERYSLIFSDVDICLRAREAGYRVVYTPFARLVHHEGSSRAQVSPREDVTRFGRRLDDLGIESDPYFHPGLHGGIPVPTIRQIDEPGASDALRWWMKEALGDMAATAPLDPHRPSELQDLASRWGLELSKPSAVPEQVEVGDSGAVGFIVATLLEDESLHRRFPTALLDGEHGSFCLWLSEEKANELGLSAAARFSIRRALSERPGESIRRLYVNQLHLQRDYPFALTPIGLRSFLRWLLTTGRVEYKLSDDSIWWYCLECWEDGAEGLLDSYLINPNWQKLFPDALTPVGWQQFVEWLAREYPAASGWLRRVAGTGPPSPSPAVYRADAFLRRT
jgi:GT2 family glycosyltransferase